MEMTMEQRNREILLGGRFIEVPMLTEAGAREVARIQECDNPEEAVCCTEGLFESRTVKVRKWPYLKFGQYTTAWGDNLKLIRGYVPELTEDEIERLTDDSVALILTTGKELNADFFDKFMPDHLALAKSMADMADSEALVQAAVAVAKANSDSPKSTSS